MNKFEKLIEYIINDEDQKARELFHDIVVEKSRDIYESIMDEESMEETVQGAEVEGMMDEVSTEEAMESDEEGEEEFELGGDVEGDGDLDGEVAGDEFDSEESEEDVVLNIDAKLDELLAKFDEIMGGGEEEVAGDDFGGEVAGDEVGAEEPEQFAEAVEGSGKSGKSGSAKSGVSGKSGSAKSGKSGKGSAELMREYVDRIGDVFGGAGDAAEGDAVGAAGKKVSVNDKSTVGPGADFGGSVVKRTGADNANPDGTSAPSSDKAQEIKSGNQNVPGGKAALAKGPSAKSGEESAVNDDSVQKQNTGKK